MDNPCIDCYDDAQCGDSCAKYRFYLSTKVETAFNKEVIQSVASIKAQPDSDD